MSRPDNMPHGTGSSEHVPSDMSPPRAEAVARLVRATCRRERLAAAASLLTRVALPLGCALAAAAVLATRRADAPAWLAWLGLAPVVGVLLHAGLRPARPRRAARRIDAHYDLPDLIGNALELSGRDLAPPADPRAADLRALHVADVELVAPRLDPRPVVPLRPPALHRPGLAAAALLVVAMLVPRPPPPVTPESVFSDMPGETDSPTIKKPAGDRALSEPLREDLRALQDGHDRAAALAEKMLEILDAYGRGELDREAAYAALEELEKALAEAEAELEARMEEDPAVLAEGVRRLAEALQQEEITQPAGEAFARGDGDEAEQALADAEAGAEADPSGAGDRALQRAMQGAEKALGKAAGENSDTASQLAEAERRLKRQQEQPASDPEEQERRLKKQQQRVEELRRQHEREKAAQRKLDQLRREARDAQRGQKGSQQRKRALDKLRRGAGDARKSSQARRLGQARDDLEEAKSFMRRAGQGGEQGDKRKQQMQKFAKAAQGKRGGKKDGPTLLVEGGLGEGEPGMMMEGDSGGDPQDSGDGGDPQDSGDGGQDSGDGQGDGQGGSQTGQGQGDGQGEGSVDPLGDPSGLKTRPKDVRVDPKQGRGTTKAEIIKTASQEGFASADYRDTYRDYRSFAQSTLDSEALPAEQRRRVKRYFQMIQPRK